MWSRGFVFGSDPEFMEHTILLKVVNHFTSPSFWTAYESLPTSIQDLADQNYAMLKANLQHPSPRFKKVGRYGAVRAGLHYRALSVEVDEGLLWFWIGSHAEYDRLIK